MFWNEDCVKGASKIPSGSIDLMIADPPYGIEGGELGKLYKRCNDFVLGGYIDVPAEEYDRFSREWIMEAERVLRPGGSIYIVSGYTNLRHVLNALARSRLLEVNHVIWKFNFGMLTKLKYVSSHYHILYCVKPGRKPTFNTWCRFNEKERDAAANITMNYRDREDVWSINREWNAEKTKNMNQLPTELLAKMIQYSSLEGDMVCDFFLGSFSTAKVAIGLNRKATGFELNKTAYDFQMERMKTISPGWLLPRLRKVPRLEDTWPFEEDDIA